MLGELYYPKGKALETAQEVLSSQNPMACNVAYGCRNCCSYCYIPYIKKGNIRFPRQEPAELVKKQLDNGLKPGAVFLSFCTDPFIKENKKRTYNLVELLLKERTIRIATLSKVGVCHSDHLWNVRTGMTIVSDSDEFRKKFEPNTLPIDQRVKILRQISDSGGYTWVSLEPFPTPKIWKQSIETLLDKINFADFIILGKWNYDRRATDKDFYSEIVKYFEEYCSEQGIRYFVKNDTLNFIGE